MDVYIRHVSATVSLGHISDNNTLHGLLLCSIGAGHNVMCSHRQGTITLKDNELISRPEMDGE